MKASWADETDINICLCCGGDLTGRGMGARITPERAERALAMFEAIVGLTREELLTKHRAQLDYQCPGFAEWLEGQ